MEVEEIDEDAPVVRENSLEEITKKFDFKRYVFNTSVKDMDKFNKLSVDVQERCIKAISRLFLMKGNIVLHHEESVSELFDVEQVALNKQ